MQSYVDVILPLPLEGLFTYLIPEEFSGAVSPGMRLTVPFGRTGTYTAIAVRIHCNKPENCKVKPIISVCDTLPSVSETQLKLLDWISSYYMCAKGDVMKAMLPAALRPDGESTHGYKPCYETCVRLPEKLDPDSLGEIIGSLRRSERQQDMLLAFLNLSGMADDSDSKCSLVTKKALLAACPSEYSLNALVSKGILEVWHHEVGRLPLFDGRLFPANELNEYQKTALGQITGSFREKDVCLLYGVTSSGKTEVYIHLIKECIDNGGQALFLLPEIALTLHIMRRLQKVFGNDMCVYHSRCSDAERAEIWKRQLGPNPFKLVVGARSAVFVPFRNLKLTIVDEEHDSSYKQEEPAPRYNARNVALVLSSFYGAKVLLGSATPSLESFFNASCGKYGLAVMEHRYMDIPLPQIDIVDVFQLRRKKRMSGLFSPLLERSIREALDSGDQVILFRNRRGYAPSVYCKACGWIPKCDSCDVSLTWHRRFRRLSCHYCGKLYDMPTVCPECGSQVFDSSGYGTEKVEEEINRLFPNAVVGRLDLDTVTSPSVYSQILQDFQDGVTNVLIGTQMVSKGLDFDRVSVVGVLSAESIIGAPDFRSSERAFQLMQQVSGRAGRKHGRGHVIIQTRQADDELYSLVTAGRYVDFYEKEVDERRLFNYPPFFRITSIYMRSSDESQLDEAATWLGAQLRAVFAKRVLGPDAPPVSRIRMQYIRKLMLKVEAGVSMVPVRERLMLLKSESESRFRKVSIYFDVDPM